MGHPDEPGDGGVEASCRTPPLPPRPLRGAVPLPRERGRSGELRPSSDRYSKGSARRAPGARGVAMPMRARFRRRYLDLLGSIYIYNEHRGYTAIDRVLDAVRMRWPDDADLIAKIEKHRADERKHYMMFRRWFERRGIRPLAVDRTCGHIDRFVGML